MKVWGVAHDATLFNLVNPYWRFGGLVGGPRTAFSGEKSTFSEICPKPPRIHAGTVGTGLGALLDPFPRFLGPATPEKHDQSGESTPNQTIINPEYNNLPTRINFNHLLLLLRKISFFAFFVVAFFFFFGFFFFAFCRVGDAN